MSSSIRLDHKWSDLATQRGILAQSSNDTDDSAIDLTGSRVRFTGKLDPDLMFHEYRQDILEELIREQEDGFGRYGDNMNRVLLIIDDAPALDVFNMKKDNLYNKLAVYLRHVRTSCIQATQNYKSMTRVLRNNQSNILLFRTENIGELKKVWEEYNLMPTFKSFMNLYTGLTNQPWSFIHISTQNDPSHQLIQNLTDTLRVNERLLIPLVSVDDLSIFL